MTAQPCAVDRELPPFDETSAPLIRHQSFRCTAVQYAHIVARALAEGKGEGAILRRWITRGAAAEGIDINTF